jgi:hypothetical protein
MLRLAQFGKMFLHVKEKSLLSFVQKRKAAREVSYAIEIQQIANLRELLDTRISNFDFAPSPPKTDPGPNDTVQHLTLFRYNLVDLHGIEHSHLTKVC